MIGRMRNQAAGKSPGARSLGLRAETDNYVSFKSSLYAVFEGVYRRKPNWAEEEIGATSATAEVARLLDTTPGKPLLFVRETTFDMQRTAIEHSHSWLRADRYKATVVSIRKR